MTTTQTTTAQKPSLILKFCAYLLVLVFLFMFVFVLIGTIVNI